VPEGTDAVVAAIEALRGPWGGCGWRRGKSPPIQTVKAADLFSEPGAKPLWEMWLVTVAVAAVVVTASKCA